MFKVDQKVTPVNIDNVLNDTLLNTSSRQIIQGANCIGTITQVQPDPEGKTLNYVTYTTTNGKVTQVYRDNEIEVAK